jgi:hypothetical protein
MSAPVVWRDRRPFARQDVCKSSPEAPPVRPADRAATQGQPPMEAA